MTQPKLKIEYLPVSNLVPYARNARTHSPEQVSQIAASIREFGFTNPVLIDGERGIIAGHGRVLAAVEVGMATVPCVALPHLTDAQRRAYVLADNRLALDAGWDEGLLRLELADLAAGGFDLGLIGFSAAETKALLAPLPGAGLTGPDEAPPVAAVAVSRPGDVWVMGAHRLLCGDSTRAEDVAALMAGAKVALLWTDPPYNVDYTGRTKDALKVAGDAQTDADFVAMLVAAFGSADAVMTPGAVYYIAHPDIFSYEFVGAVRSVGWRQARPAVVLWIKDSMVLGRGDYHARSEPILYGWKPGAAHHTVVDRSQDNVWEIPRPKVSSEHPTMKPVELIARAIRNSSNAGDCVLDTLSGSGTTIIAAEMTGRSCYAIEIAPVYVDVGVRRWQAFTGKDAVRESDGKTFNEAAA